MTISHGAMQEALDAQVEFTAEQTGVSAFWIELGMVLIPLLIMALIVITTYSLLSKLPSKEDVLSPKDSEGK